MDNDSSSGISFGLASGVITTIGVIIGLGIGTQSQTVIIAAVLTIAFVDAFSDAFGMHLAKEAEDISAKHVWKTTIITFISKLIFALTFLVPVVLFDLNNAIIASVIWTLVLLSFASYFIAKKEKKNPRKIIAGHLLIAIIVIVITNFIGIFISVFI